MGNRFVRFDQGISWAWRPARRAVLTLALLMPLLAASLEGGPARAAETPAQPPAVTVERVNEALLEVMMQAKELGFDGRRERLTPVLEETFAFGEMARVSAGQYWKQLTDEQRSELIDRFGALSIATFAARFDGYSGERWNIVETVDQPRGSRLVRNQLIRPNGETVLISYLLRPLKGEWRIFDVILDKGYSELALRRSENTGLLGQGGFTALIGAIDQKIARLETDS